MSKISQEIIKDFTKIYNKRSVKLNFVKKFTISDLYVSKKTGCLIPSTSVISEHNLSAWNKRYKNKKYSSKSSHFVSRHAYVISQIENCIKFKKKFKNLKVADLGCGNGGFVNLLNKLSNQKIIVGFDESEYNYKSNNKYKKNKKIKFVRSAIEQINEKKFNNYFDLIVLTWTLSCCSNPLVVLDKIKKIIKPNGVLVIAESSRILVQPVYKLEYYLDTKSNIDTFVNYPWRFSYNSLNNLLMLKNFKLIHCNDYRHNENMVMVFESRKFIKKKYKFDDYKKIITFFKKWKKYSNFFKI